MQKEGKRRGKGTPATVNQRPPTQKRAQKKEKACHTKQSTLRNDIPSRYRWALRDSNPRPSACKADALNQLS